MTSILRVSRSSPGMGNWAAAQWKGNAVSRNFLGLSPLGQGLNSLYWVYKSLLLG